MTATSTLSGWLLERGDPEVTNEPAQIDSSGADR